MRRRLLKGYIYIYIVRERERGRPPFEQIQAMQSVAHIKYRPCKAWPTSNTGHATHGPLNKYRPCKVLKSKLPFFLEFFEFI